MNGGKKNGLHQHGNCQFEFHSFRCWGHDFPHFATAQIKGQIFLLFRKGKRGQSERLAT